MDTTNPSSVQAYNDYDDDSSPLIGQRAGKFFTKKKLAIVGIVLILGVVIGVVVWKTTSSSDCSTLNAPTHGNISCTSTLCNFTCDHGYHVIGQKQLTCNKGKWNGTEPMCLKPCPKLKIPSHGNITCKNGTENVNATCTFSCDKGYDVIGKNSMTCTNGNWSGAPPVCESPCPKLIAPSHGSITCQNGTKNINATCTFACDKGYGINGTSRMTCTNGNWSGIPPVCELLTCPKLNRPSHGNITCKNVTKDINATCTFSCDKGYDIVGASQLTCTYGNWSGTPPDCVLKCPALTKPKHGNITCTKATKTANATCHFLCDKGYNMTGSDEVTCVHGKWSSSQPVCVKGCPSLKPPAHGHMNCTDTTEEGNVTCSFSCDNGYMLHGSDMAKCANGNWSGTPPTCVPQCPALGNLTNGNITCDSNKDNTSEACTITCNKGFVLVGRSELNCTDGLWNGSLPHCVAACSILTPPDHGNISCTNGSGSQLNESCTFTCDHGYELTGPKIRHCVNGIWDGIPAQCSKPCPPLSPVKHGHISCKNLSSDLNETCTFTCDKGYNMFGPRQVNCTNGKWDDDTKTTCRNDCLKLKHPDFGNVTCNDGHKKNSTCNFTCDSYHHIQGNKSLTCEASGQWSFPEPKCVCPKCYVGTKCDESISWNDVVKALNGISWLKSKTVHYGGETFTCKVSPRFLIKWSATCTDSDGKTITCQKYGSKSEAATHAAAELIRSQESLKKYPAPCDPEDMPHGCNQ